MLDDSDIQKLIQAQKEVFVTKEEFEGLIEIVATKEELNKTDKKIDAIGKDVKEIKSMLNDFTGRTAKLEMDVKYIENILDVPAKKH